MEKEYFERALNECVVTARAECAGVLDAIMRQHAAAGRLASGAILKALTDETVGVFEASYLEAQRFTFELAGSNEYVARLSRWASEMISSAASRFRPRWSVFFTAKRRRLHLSKRCPTLHFSYELAFNHLAGSIRERWQTNGLMQAPLFYMALHSMELHLKWAIEEFESYTGEKSKDYGHSCWTCGTN